MYGVVIEGPVVDDPLAYSKEKFGEKGHKGHFEGLGTDPEHQGVGGDRGRRGGVRESTPAPAALNCS